MPSVGFPLPIPIPTAGLQKTTPPVTVGFNGLIDGENWVYRDGRFFVRPGLSTWADDIDQRPLGFIQYDDPEEAKRLIMGTDDGLWKYNAVSGEWDDISGAALSGTLSSQVVLRTFERGGNVYVLGCNGVDDPFKWHEDENSGEYQNIATVPAGAQAARCMVVCANRLVLAQGQTIYASDNLDFDAYTDAYYNPIADTPGDIIAMLEFGNEQFAIYKEGSIYMAFAQVDLTAKYRVELIRADISGPVSPLSVVMLGESGMHCWLSRSGDVMLFNGNTVQSMGENIRTHIRQTRDFDLRGRTFGFFDPLQNDVYFFYASKGATDIDTAAVINIESGSIHSFRFPNQTISAGGAYILADSVSVGDLPVIDTISMTFADMDRGVTGILLGGSGGQVYNHTGTTDNGSAINAWFATGMQVGPEPRRFNLLHQAEHYFPTTPAAAQNVSIYLGASDYGEEIAYDSAQTVDVAAGGPYLTQHRLPGRFYSIKMQVTSSYGAEWMGSEATLTPTGLR